MAENKLTPGSPEGALEKCLAAVRQDPEDLERYDAYRAGDHDDVYIPDDADVEFNMLAERAVLNLIPLVINSVAQACYVESIRHAVDLGMDRDGEDATMVSIPPEMESWQHNRMDARQIPIVRALASHGVVYTLTRKDAQGRARYEAYTGHRATAIFDDYVNDLDPSWGLVIKRGTLEGIEEAHLYSEKHVRVVTPTNGGRFEIGPPRLHGLSTCPITRATLNMDLDGRAVGLIEPLIKPQNQVNQSSFDVLALQSYSSFNVRYISGTKTPIRRWTKQDIDQMWPEPDPSDPDYEEKRIAWLQADKPQAGDPVLDSNGQEVQLPLRVNHKRFIMTEAPDAKVGQLQGADVRSLLDGLSERVKYFFAVSQTPSSYGVGEMANLSAEALRAAEAAKTRRDDGIKMVLAELYERNFRLGMEIEGHGDRAGDINMEIVWADTDPHSLGVIADGFGKMADQLGVPVTALWEDLPGMTTGKLKHWLELKEKEREETPELEMVRKMDELDTFSLTDPEGVEVSG